MEVKCKDLVTCFLVDRYLKIVFSQSHIAVEPIAMRVCTLIEVTNVINHANLDGCMLRSLVSAKGSIQAFSIIS